MYKQVIDTDGEYGKQIVQDLILPETHTQPEVLERYARFGRRIHWIDTNVVPGAFQMNTSWYFKPNRPENVEQAGKESGLGVFKPHKHDSDEILGFYGSNPDDPYDLGGEVELFIEGESHILTKSSLVFLPGGMEHCPLYVNKVDSPIFHFSIITEAQYTLRHDDEGGKLVVAE